MDHKRKGGVCGAGDRRKGLLTGSLPPALLSLHSYVGPTARVTLLMSSLGICFLHRHHRFLNLKSLCPGHTTLMEGAGFSPPEGPELG